MNRASLVLGNSAMKLRKSPCAKNILETMGGGNGRAIPVIEAIPFSLNDTTAGAENEFQVVVEGNRNNVDLPLIIEGCGYYRNILKRIKSGEASGRAIADIEKFLNDITKNVWESSWVRFPRRTLTHFANTIFMNDLMTDKNKPDSSLRSDFHKFIILERNEEMIRIPVYDNERLSVELVEKMLLLFEVFEVRNGARFKRFNLLIKKILASLNRFLGGGIATKKYKSYPFINASIKKFFNLQYGKAAYYEKFVLFIRMILPTLKKNYDKCTLRLA